MQANKNIRNGFNQVKAGAYTLLKGIGTWALIVVAGLTGLVLVF